MFIEQVISDLKFEEGFRAKPYQDHLGVWTIGYGFTSLTMEEAEAVLRIRVKSLNIHLTRHDWYRNLNDTRRAVVLEMAFQLGLEGLYKFKRMIRALENRWFNAAADEMYRSRWREQTPNRALRMIDKMRAGA